MAQLILRIFYFCIFVTLLVGCSKQAEPPASDLFAGLSAPNQATAEVVEGYTITFPEDHNSHPEFAIEWWYLTANLTDTLGNMYPIQWTLFRFANSHASEPWSDDQLYMAHAKIITKDKTWFEERFARGGVGNAGQASEPFSAFMDDWSWQSPNNGLFPSQLYFRLNHEASASLQLTADGPFIFHGNKGYSKKVRYGKQASYYYSQPFIHLSGILNLPGGEVEVSGPGWFDHEWTSQYLATETLGWDWFSLHLDDGSKLMLFNLRQEKGDKFWSGSYITREGIKHHLSSELISAKVTENTLVNQRDLPLFWQVEIPKFGIDISIAPFKKEQWNSARFAYYEGAINVAGTHSGVGFIELTGY